MREMVEAESEVRSRASTVAVQDPKVGISTAWALRAVEKAGSPRKEGKDCEAENRGKRGDSVCMLFA